MTSHTATNARNWRSAQVLDEYANRTLRPVEALILLRHRDDFAAGEVLEIGCGGGRLTGYLAELSPQVHAIDISAEMLGYSRRTYPSVEFEERDLAAVGDLGDGRFTAVFAPFNVISVLDHEARLKVLDDLARILVAGGLLVFSAHNRAFIPRLHSPAWVVSRDPRTALGRVRHLPESVRNHRRMRRLERDEESYALVNDLALNYSLLHYYISRDAQERQLAEHGFTLLECLDKNGAPVGPGDEAAHESELHYVARKL